MKFLSSLDPKDRRLLLWSLGTAITLALFIGFVLPNGNGNDNPLPSTYLAGQHGARAAYDSLLRAGYPIERWERPLGELAAIADSHTVVIFAQPFTREREDVKAVSQIIERGGRVLSTGFWGGFLLPDAEAGTPKEFTFAACKLEPEGLDPHRCDRRSVDGSRSHLAGGKSKTENAIQLCRPACCSRVRLRQRSRGVVGKCNPARKRNSIPRPGL